MVLLAIPRAIRRHKRKLYITVFLITGSYLAIKWAIRNFKSNYLLQSKQKYLCMKKLEHFYTIQQTADEATITLLKSLNESIKKCLNNEALIEELKQKPKNKLEIWEQLKVMCITRCLTSVYSISILILCIKTILNIIGGYMYIINVSNSGKEKIELTQNVQQKFLENIELFIKNGLPKLVNKLSEMTNMHFKEIPLKESLTINFIEKKFQEIIVAVEASKEFYFKNSKSSFMSLESSSSSSDLASMPSNQLKIDDFNFMTVYLFEDFYLDQMSTAASSDQSDYDKQILKTLNLEAFDVLSCDDCLVAFNSLKFYIFEFFINNLTQEIIQQANPLSSNNENVDGLIQISIPFAKLIPLMDKMFDKLFNSDNNCLINDLLANKTINTFSANIYETFSYSSERD